MKMSEMKNSNYFKGFIMGEPGTGKTVGACSFPGPIKMYDFDQKASSAYSYYKKHDPKKLEEIDVINCGSRDSKGSGYAAMDKDLEPIVNEYKKTGELSFNTLIIDSSTIMAQEMLNWLVEFETGIKRNRDVRSRKVAGLQDYMVFAPTFTEFLQLVLGLPCHFIMTGHVQITQDELTKEIHRSASIPGKSGKTIGVYFPELYVTKVNSKGQYVAQTKADYKFPCRTQLQGVPNEIEFNYESISKYLV